MRAHEIDQRAWRKRAPLRQGVCRAEEPTGRRCLLDYEIGIETTGRSKVFSCFYVSIRLMGGEVITGTDTHNLLHALISANIVAVEKFYALNLIGLDPDFKESGLSHNSGWGYHPSSDEAVYMMSPILPGQSLEGDQEPNAR